VLGKIVVLLSHEYSLLKEVLVDLLAIGLGDKPAGWVSDLVMQQLVSVEDRTLLRVPCALRGIAHDAGFLGEIEKCGG